MTKKKAKLVLLDAATEEMLEITRLYKELAGSVSARKIYKRIHSALNRLREHPNMGVALEDKELRRQGYRKLICDNYLCFYRLAEDTILVYHIADGRTEYKMLFRSLPTDK